MKIITIIIAATLAFGITACSKQITAEKCSSVTRGMTKAKVIKIMGKDPDTSGNSGVVESVSWTNMDGSNCTVMFNKGKVEAKASHGL